MRKSIVLTAAALFAAAAACPTPAVAKPKVSDITVTKKPDKASPTLMRSITAPRDAATGQASGKRQHAR
jgi:type VI protein secretion system component Hcp